MSYLFATNEEESKGRAADMLNGVPPFDPEAQPAPFLQGIGTGIGQGYSVGIAKTFRRAGEVGLGLTGLVADKFDNKQFQKEVEDESLKFDNFYQDWIDKSTVDPRTIGFAGKALGGFVESVPTFLTSGAPGLGLSAAEEAQRALRAEGVEPSTATGISVPLGIAQALFAEAPILGKGLATRLGYGALSNTAFGAASNGAQELALNALGYPDVAKQYAQNPESLSSDFLTGLLFGAHAHVFGGGKERDALNTLKLDDNFRNGAPQGKPADTQSAILHEEAMLKASEDAVRGEPVDVPPETANAHFVEDPIREARAEDIAKAVQELAHENGVKVVAPGVHPVPDLILADVGHHPAVPDVANESVFQPLAEAPKPSIETKAEISPLPAASEDKTKTLQDAAKELGIEHQIEFPDGQVLGAEDAAKRVDRESEENDLLAKATKAASECYLETLT